LEIKFIIDIFQITQNLFKSNKYKG